MQAKLEFDLNDPDDKQRFQYHAVAEKFLHAIWNYDQKLRKLTKHPSEDMSSDTLEAFHTARNLLYLTLKEDNLELEMLL